MKHYNEDAQCCYPQTGIMDVCKNCARYIENKKDGEYIIVNYRTSGRAFISTNEQGEQVADCYYDCHSGNDYYMYEQFDDELDMYGSPIINKEEAVKKEEVINEQNS